MPNRADFANEPPNIDYPEKIIRTKGEIRYCESIWQRANAFFYPQEFLRYVASVRGVDVETFRIPPRIVMVYPRRYFDLVVRLVCSRPVEWWWYKDRLKMSSGSFNNVQMVVAMNFVGSSAAAMVFEELIACGARQIIEVGVSGGIQPFLKPGNIVIASEAICDEGITSQYFEGPQKFKASQNLRSHLIEALNNSCVDHQSGMVVATDGVYRETKRKLAKFRQMGALAINMETSALYAVVKHRSVEIASALVLSNLLTDSGWQPVFSDPRVLSGMQTLLRLLVQAISKA